MARVKEFDETLVLQKAVALFWKKGYNATSIQDLVDYLGINRASIYDTYGNKQALFDKALTHYQESNFVRVSTFLQQYDSVKEAIHKLLESAVIQATSECETRGCLVVNITAELLPGEGWVTEMVQNNKLQMETIFTDLLQKGIDRGEISPDKDIKALSTLIYTLYSGINIVCKIDQNRERLLAVVKAGLSALD